MSRIIIIGEASLEVFFDADARPVASVPGSILLNAASILARRGREVSLVSEIGTDPTGEVIMRYLTEAGVSTYAIDRFSEGATPCTLNFPGPDGSVLTSRYERYPDGAGLDVPWPRIDSGDIVAVGGYIAVSQRVHENLRQFIANALDRGARLVFLPGFWDQRVTRITRVMPVILEIMERADVVITRTPDLPQLYSTSDPARVFASNISFYVPVMYNIDADAASTTLFRAKTDPVVSVAPSLPHTHRHATLIADILGSL